MTLPDTDEIFNFIGNRSVAHFRYWDTRQISLLKPSGFADSGSALPMPPAAALRRRQCRKAIAPPSTAATPPPTPPAMAAVFELPPVDPPAVSAAAVGEVGDEGDEGDEGVKGAAENKSFIQKLFDPSASVFNITSHNIKSFQH